MALGNLDSNGIGRYVESTPIGTKFSDYLNLALETVSAAFTTLKNRVTAVEKPPLVILSKSASQALTIAEAALTWNIETKKTVAGMHSNSSNTSRVVCTKAGVYRVTCTVYNNNNTAGIGTLRIALNGGLTIPGAWTRVASSNAGAPLHVSVDVALAVGDFIEAMVSHSAATGNIEGTGSVTAPALSAYLVSAP